MRYRIPLYGLIATLALSLYSHWSPSLALKTKSPTETGTVKTEEKAKPLQYKVGETWVYRNSKETEAETYEGRERLFGMSFLKFKRETTRFPRRIIYDYFLTDAEDMTLVGEVTLFEDGKIRGFLDSQDPAVIVDRPLYVGKKWQMHKSSPVRFGMSVTSQSTLSTPAGTFDSFELTPEINSEPRKGLERYWSEKLGYFVRKHELDADTGAPLDTMLVEHRLPKK